MIRRGVLSVLLMDDTIADAEEGQRFVAALLRPVRASLARTHGEPSESERSEWAAMTKTERRALVEKAKAEVLRGEK